MRTRTLAQAARHAQSGPTPRALAYYRAVVGPRMCPHPTPTTNGMGHTHMGTRYGFTSWALHMAMLILFSNLYGWLFREWVGSDTRPRRALHVGMAIIVLATLIITYGNYLGES